MAISAKEVVFKIVGDTDSFIKGYDEAGKALDDFEKKTKNTEKVLNSIAKQSGLALTAIAGTGIALGKIASDFNTALAPIETLIPGNTERINELKKAIQDLSPAVHKSTDDLSSGAYNIISAYGDAGDTVEKLAISAKAAAAGLATTNDAINLLSAVTKAYGDTSATAQKKVADLAFITLKNGQTNFPELATAIQKVTSLSATLGISQKELFAVFASGTGVIGGAARVATDMAAAEAELLKGTTELNVAFEALGVKTGKELIEKSGGFVGALNELKNYADKTEVSITNLFGSIEAGKIALYLTGEGAAKFSGDLESMAEFAGALDTAFEASTTGVNSFAVSLDTAQANAKVFAQRLGDEVLNSSRGALSVIVNFSSALADMDEGTLRFIISMGKVIIPVAAVTAAIAVLTLANLKLRNSIIAVTGAMAANPIGLALIGVTAAIAGIAALSDHFKQLEEDEKKAHNAAIAQTEALKKQSAQSASLAQEYDALTKKENKTNAEMEKMQTIMAELKKHYPNLTEEVLKNAAAHGELQKAIAATGIAEMEKQFKELSKQLDKERKELSRVDIGDQSGEIFNTKYVEEAREKAEQTRLAYVELAAAIAETKEQLYVGKENQSPALTVKPKTAENGQINPPEKTGTKTQGAELKELDDQYAVRRELAARNGQDIFDIDTEWNEKRLSLLSKFIEDDVANRKQGVSAMAALDASMESSLAEGMGRIAEQIDKTKNRLDELSSDPLPFNVDVKLNLLKNGGLNEQDALKQIADEAKKIAEAELSNSQKIACAKLQIETAMGALGETSQEYAANQSRLIALDKDLEDSEKKRTDALLAGGEAEKRILITTAETAIAQTNRRVDAQKELDKIKGLSNAEIEEAANTEKINQLSQKRNELAGEYARVASEGTGENKENAEKLDLIKNEIAEIDAEMENTTKAAKSWRDVLGDVTKNLETAKTAASAVGSVASDIINNDAETKAQESAVRLAEIEREKNEALTEIDNELYDMREQHRIENEEREAEYQERMYEMQMADYERSITELQNKFANETTIENLRNIEKQLEAEKKKKREAQEAKQKEQEDKKRAAEQLKQENEVLNKRNELEWEFTVSKIETENAAGDAAANAAIEAAKWQKASAVIQLTVQHFIDSARAASAYPIIPSMIAYGVAATLDLVNAGIVASQPDPPRYIRQPLPPAPRKLAGGGIFMPSAGGTPILTAAGNPAVVAEANVPELYLPITAENIDKLFDAANTNKSNKTENSLVYSPVFNVSLVNTGEALFDDFIAYVHDNALRDFHEMMNEAKEKYEVGK